MKRARLEEEEEEQSYIDWTRLFHIESILLVLHPYLSTTDLIHLSCVNKHMNTSWINNERRLSVLNMRERIQDMTGRVYNVKNPVRCIKSAYLKALKPVKLEKGKWRFTCWRCQNQYSIRLSLVTHRDFKARTCLECAKRIFHKNHTLAGGSDVFYNIWVIISDEEDEKEDGGYLVPYITQWPRDLIQRIEDFIRPHIIRVRFVEDCTMSYIHKDYLQEPIAWVREAFASPPPAAE
jgi:transcription elongation factor Elf1